MPHLLVASDNQLMARMQAGSGEAFSQLYDRYCDRAYRVAQSVSSSTSNAEDAVQDAFLSVWNSRDTYRPERLSAAPWLLTVVRYRAIDIARRETQDRHHRTGHQISEDLDTGEDIAGDAAQNIDGRRVRLLLARLPEAQQEVVVLAFYGQLTHTEIADTLDLPLGTVKSRMRLGFDQLRIQLDRADTN